MYSRHPSSSRVARILRACAVACCCCLVPALASEDGLDDGAKKAGHAVGSAVREIGKGFKQAGKAVGEGAKKVGKAAKEGGKAVKRGVKGED